MAAAVQIPNDHVRRLRAAAGFRLPPLEGEPLQPRRFTVDDLDTPPRSLARAGIALRRQTEADRTTWRLSLPAGGSHLELEEPGSAEAPPHVLARLLVAHERHGGLATVATLRTHRRAILARRDGVTAEVTVDDVAATDGERLVELAVELRSGKPKQLDELARELELAGAWPTTAVRAPPPVDAPPPRDVAETPVDALRRRLRDQLVAIERNDPGTRLGVDPESLHDMRVAVRRSRALLRAGRALVAEDTQELREELRWLGGVLGGVRDLDVLLARLGDEAAALDDVDRAAARHLLRALGQERTRARRTLLRTLGGRRYLSLLARLDATIESLTPSGAERTLAGLAQRQARRVRRAAGGLGGDPLDEELHALRKLVKRMRYAYELSGDVAVVRRAKALQDVLGEHQDSVVAEERLRSLAAEAPAGAALAAGRLVAAERVHRRAARAGWRAAWRRLERATR